MTFSMSDEGTPMFSVVIPLYNKAPFIAGTIACVLGQSVSPAEIIVVDDGSTDGGLEIVEAIRDSRIRIVRTTQARSGPSIARNMGVKVAVHPWIAFLDADDHWDRLYLQSARELLDRAGDDVVCVMTAWLASDGVTCRPSKIARRYSDEAVLDFRAFVERWLSARHCPMWTSAIIVSRAAMLACGGFPEDVRRGEDKVAWFRIMQRGRGIYNPKPLATYNLGVPGQETAGFVNDLHPLCREIALLPENGPIKTDLLSKLYNQQIIRYFMDIKFREKMSPKTMEGFRVRLNPLWFLVINVSRNIPLSWQRSAYNQLKRR